MSCYHCNVSIISRSSGRSSVAAAAYRSGTKLVNDRDGITHDYRRKGGVDYSEVVLPEGAPERFYDREVLWNEVERTERRKDSQLAREIEFALPVEVSDQEKIEIARTIAKYFASKGMVVDFAIHNMHGHNPHVHMMLTLRECDGEGFAKKKNRDWNARENVELWRAQVAVTQNFFLAKHGFPLVDHRSYKARGIDKVPTKHEGVAVRAMEERAKRIAEEEGREYEPVTVVRAQNEEERREIEEIDRQMAALTKEREEAINAERRERQQQSLREAAEDRRADRRIETLGRDIESKGSRIEQVGRDIESKGSRIEELEQGIEPTRGRVEELRERVARFRGGVDRLRKWVFGVHAVIEDLGAAVADTGRFANASRGEKIAILDRIASRCDSARARIVAGLQVIGGKGQITKEFPSPPEPSRTQQEAIQGVTRARQTKRAEIPGAKAPQPAPQTVSGDIGRSQAAAAAWRGASGRGQPGKAR